MPEWVLDQRRAVGQRIRALRHAEDIAMDVLALRAGVGKDTVFRAETARIAVTLDSLLLIANGLGVPASALFDDLPPGPGPS